MPKEPELSFFQQLIAFATLAGYALDIQGGQRVLDACCAPGGKTGQILELANVDLVAIDNDAARIARTESNLDRLNLKANLQVGDAANPEAWWDGKFFDRILADVPCTASGIVRRHVDIKWLRREEDIVSFTAQQAKILPNLWKLLAKGGKLLYQVVKNMLDKGERFELTIAGPMEANSYWHDLERCFPEYVKVLGFISEESLYGVLS